MSIVALPKELYFTTTTVIDWVDVFTRPMYKHIILESLAYCQESKGLVIYAWVLMSNHLHMIVGCKEDDMDISSILRDFKKYTSKKVIAAISENQEESRSRWMLDRFLYAGKYDNRTKTLHFWQEGNHIEHIYSIDFLLQKLNYIHQNPVRQEIVERPDEYLYSSARDYAGMKGLLNITLIK